MSIVQKDISNLEASPELPDTYLKEGDFLRVKTDGSGDTEWFDTNTGNIVIGTGLFGNGTVTNPSIAFNSDQNTGIYRLGEDNLGITTGGIQRLDINGSSVEVGTLSNNLNFNVNGNSSATNFRVGNGTNANPSYSFTTGTGQDCGMYYLDNAGNDELRFATNGNLLLSLTRTDRTSFINSKFLCNTGSTTNPALIFNSTATSTGISGDSSNNIYTLTNANINTTHTTNSFDVGRTNSNNTNTRTLNVNGASNFNSYTPDYSLILNNQTSTGKIKGSHWNIACNETTGTYIVGTANSIAGDYRMLRSAPNNLTSWTEFESATFLYGNMRHCAYGNGVWVVGTAASVGQNFFHSLDDGLTWTQHANAVPFNSTRAYSRLRYINGQFIALSGVAEGRVAFSSDGQNWSLRKIITTNYALTDIIYSPELRIYVISTTSNAILYYEDPTNAGITNSTTFIEQTSNVYDSVDLGYSPKLGLFIQQSSTTNANWSSSNDGKNWRVFTPIATTNNVQNTIQWCPDFGGFFFATQNATTNNLIVSRDGFTWSQAPLSISGNSRSSYYNSTTRTFVFGLDANLTFKNATTDFNNYIDSDNIYNTFNSNIRFNDVIEYRVQSFVCNTGNNHFTPSVFNRPVISFDTINTNANIYLQGTSFNGRVGTKFKFEKTISTNNNVIIHGYETCRLISPYGEFNSFNAQSSPAVYSIIPVGYFGSFDLTRVSDSGNGVWLIDNVNVYSSAGVERKLDDMSIAGNLTVSGTISGFTGLNNANMTGTTSFERVVYNPQDLFGGPTKTNTTDLSHNYIRAFTNSGNVIITLAGGTGNNTNPGTRFKFEKMELGNSIIIEGIASTSPALFTPMGTTAVFNNVNMPNSYIIIPENYFGSFELVRSGQGSSNLGIWIVENLNIIDTNANTFLDTKLKVNKDIDCNGRLLVYGNNPGETSYIDHNLEVVGYLRYPIEEIKDITWTTGYDVKYPDMLGLGKYNYFISGGSTPSIYLQNINRIQLDNFTFYFCIAENGTTTTNYNIQNDMGGSHIVKVYRNGGITTLTATQTTTVDMHQWTRCTYKHNYRGGNNYWLVHHYNSNV